MTGFGKALAAAVWLLGASLAAAGPTQLTVDQMRGFGQQAVLKGYADQALGISDALLARDRADSAAWTLRAQALRMTGELRGSEAAARQAWRVAADKAARYAAATALAQALSLQDHRTRAQYWLRQAVQNAPTGAAQRQALQDYDYVRGQNPVNLQFSGSIRPSDNVNGGGTVRAIQFGPIVLVLPSTLQALSGTSWTAGVSGQYRLTDDGTVQTALTFGANVQGVVLSDAAKVKAPDLNNGDFSYEQVQIGWQRRALLSFGRLTTDLSLGHSWYAGQSLADSLTGAIALDHPLTQDLDLHLGLNLTQQLRLDRVSNSSTTLDLEASLTQTLASGDHIQTSLELVRVGSAYDGIDRREIGLSVGWKAGKPLAGFGLGADLTGRYALYGSGREDWRYGAGLSATVNGLTYLGFAPVVSLEVAHNDSNTPWFSSDTVAVGVSLKSRF